MNKFIEKLNKEQQEAVLHTDGPLLILAGAGSGKTRVITNRIAYLIQEKGVDARQILAITFTNKAAAEMLERVESQLGMAAGGAWISTFHSMCVKILRMYAHLLGYDNNFTIYDGDDQRTLVKNVCKKLNIDNKQFKEKWFISQISSAKDKLIDSEQFELDAGSDFYLKKVAAVYKEYEKELRLNNAMDFDDLINKTILLFRRNPEILERYQERFKYISVDEYQDTNFAQFKLVSLLADKYKNICVVGDDDQSIYKFRGADIGNILNFEKNFPGAKVIRLEQNYRSTQNILNAANAVIKNNTQRKEKRLWTENEEGSKIKFYYVDNPYQEADKVVSEIRKFVREGGHLNDCACLYRTNAQSRALEEAFLRFNMPYKIFGGVNFYQRKEIKDVLAYLKTIDNGDDGLAVKRIINEPKRGIGAGAVNTVQEFADSRGITFWAGLDTGINEGVFGRGEAKLRVFRDIIEELKSEVGEVTLPELMDDVLNKTGYLAELQAEKTVEAQTRIENIDELINKLVQYNDNAEEPTLNGFLEEVALVADIDSWDSTDDYVSLITIHSAKGLEFPNVFMCGMEDGLFPMNASLNSDDASDLEEERRLAYVAITRAQKNLIMTASKTRMIRGETMSSTRSRFVKEIPPMLLDEDRGNVPETTKKIVEDDHTNTFMTGKEFFKSKPFGGGTLGNNPYSSPEKKQFGNGDASSLGYAVGDTVSHIKFGEGIVKEITSGGRDFEVTVDFEDWGVKKMFAAFAKLKKI